MAAAASATPAVAEQPAEGRKQATTDDFSCNICFEILVDPVVGSCGHDFCMHCLRRWDKQQRQHARRRNVTCPVCRKVFAAMSATDLSVCIRLRDTIQLMFPEQLTARKADVQREVAEEAAAEAAAQERARAAAAERARRAVEEAARAADQAAIYALYGSDDESDDGGDPFALNFFPRLHPALPGAAGAGGAGPAELLINSVNALSRLLQDGPQQLPEASGTRAAAPAAAAAAAPAGVVPASNRGAVGAGPVPTLSLGIRREAVPAPAPRIGAQPPISGAPPAQAAGNTHLHQGGTGLAAERVFLPPHLGGFGAPAPQPMQNSNSSAGPTPAAQQPSSNGPSFDTAAQSAQQLPRSGWLGLADALDIPYHWARPLRMPGDDDDADHGLAAPPAAAAAAAAEPPRNNGFGFAATAPLAEANRNGWLGFGNGAAAPAVQPAHNSGFSFGTTPQPAGNSGFMGAPAAQQPNSSNRGFAPAQTVPGPFSGQAQQGPSLFDFSFRPPAAPTGVHSFAPAQSVAGHFSGAALGGQIDFRTPPSAAPTAAQGFGTMGYNPASQQQQQQQQQQMSNPFGVQQPLQQVSPAFLQAQQMQQQEQARQQAQQQAAWQQQQQQAEAYQRAQQQQQQQQGAAFQRAQQQQAEQQQRMQQMLQQHLTQQRQPQQHGPNNGFSSGHISQPAPQHHQPAAAAGQHSTAHAQGSRIMAAITTALAVPLPPMPDAPCFTMGWYAPRTVPAVPPVNSNRVGTRNARRQNIRWQR